MDKPTVSSSARLASSGNNSSNVISPTTIREIKSRTMVNNSAKNILLANRRQAMSMERLNSGGSGTLSSTSSLSNDRGKNSPSSGSSNSINSSNTSSPQRSNGLNRTASRVSRFKSAKAVFERLSSNSSASTKPERPPGPEKPRGTVASRYAAAAAARATAHANNVTTSPRSRYAANNSPSTSLAKSHDAGKSSSNVEIHKAASSSMNTQQSPKSDVTQPKPQPRVIANRLNNLTASKTSTISTSGPSSTGNKSSIQAKPPPQELIDKIVLEIASDAVKQKPDPDCTIQDLSNCDISGIPETLDFDRCFQDVEMMTEEEARKLLSKKPENITIESSDDILKVNVTIDAEPNNNFNAKQIDCPMLIDPIENIENQNPLQQTSVVDGAEVSQDESKSLSPSENSSISKTKVRFSDEPAKVYDTHAVEDYDRRNKDIDPVAASAEYELEKSKERLEENNSDDENFSSNDPAKEQAAEKSEEDDRNDSKEYIESLERELNLKRILEQNLRDLQSQYYEAVKELDDYKSTNEIKLNELEKNVNELNSKLECCQNEFKDTTEQSNQFEKQYNDIKESSQILEKKYHRAKRIIKDMQAREQSFSRREQLYQQKLDEIEYELGLLIDSVYKTIHEDSLKFNDIFDTNTNTATSCQRQHYIRLDSFGLIRQILGNFNNNQSTQNPQIKQRVVSILEQQLANLMIISNHTPPVGSMTTVGTIPIVSQSTKNISSDISSMQQAQFDSIGKQSHESNSYQLASHRLSQPNLPHPIGVGGQPTKVFHGSNPMPITSVMSTTEPSPPQSVNSYPSTNSLNSLNNNNNINSLNNNNLKTANNNLYPMKQTQPLSDIQIGGSGNMLASLTSTTSTAASTIISDDKFHSIPDIQVPYQTNEWHDKPVCEWTTTQVSTWLLALGLDQYISKFEDRNVNGQSLINLDSTLLKGYGVLNSNDRNLLKKKIRELRVEMEKEKKLREKRIKENLKDKFKNKQQATGNNNGGNRVDNRVEAQQQSNKSSWTKGLLS